MECCGAMTDRSSDFDEALWSAAHEAMAHAHAPYSGFAVGAAVRLADGEIIIGSNFENASLGLSLCAETVAIAATNSAGKLRGIVAIAVTGEPKVAQEKAVESSPLTPCGRCRQILAEASQLAGRDIPVYCADSSGKNRVRYSVSELLPHAFSATAFVGGSEC